MNFAAVFGTIAAILISAYAILESTSNTKIFLNVHGIVIVIGGTLTVALLSFSFKKLYAAVKIVFRKVFGNERDDYLFIIKTIVKLSEVYRVNPKGLKAAMPPKSHPFLVDAIDLITNYGFSYDEMDEILTISIKGKTKRDDEEIKVWHTISRFPPAFGLLGATLGMISLLQTLGEPGAQERIGPAMATALVATFYGLLVANLLLLPMTEKLSAVSSSDVLMRQIIKNGVLLIIEKKHPTFIEEFLKNFLPPGKRGTIGESNKNESRKSA